MSNIVTPIFSGSSTDELKSYLDKQMYPYCQGVTNNINLINSSEFLNGQKLSGFTDSVEIISNHNLGKVPSGFIPLDGEQYTRGSVWNAKQVSFIYQSMYYSIKTKSGNFDLHADLQVSRQGRTVSLNFLGEASTPSSTLNSSPGLVPVWATPQSPSGMSMFIQNQLSSVFNFGDVLSSGTIGVGGAVVPHDFTVFDITYIGIDLSTINSIPTSGLGANINRYINKKEYSIHLIR
jgi:hypothetical protein